MESFPELILESLLNFGWGSVQIFTGRVKSRKAGRMLGAGLRDENLVQGEVGCMRMVLGMLKKENVRRMIRMRD